VEPVNVAAVLTRLGAMIDAERIARIQEAERALNAEIARVEESVSRNNETWRRLHSIAGARVARVMTPHERLLLGRLNKDSHLGHHRGVAELRAGRKSEAQKHLDAYDCAQGTARWVWDVMIERADTGVDNRSLTDNFVLPGEIVTVVEQVDPAGRPLKLSRYGVAP
jgi:hypothetical protein